MREKSVMQEQWLKEIVPVQTSGQSSYTYTRIECRNNYHVKECYNEAVKRLYHVNKWQEYAGQPTAGFQLFDDAGSAVNRTVQKGDYLRIDIPGPGNPEVDGGDWVQVKEMGEKTAGELQLTFITVQAARNPLIREKDAAHFFDKPATSTFVIYRKQLTILAAVFGRNEHSNVKSRNIFTRIRNWFVYIGAQLGLANVQWKALTHGLLH